MRRNSGIIGPIQTTAVFNSGAIGIHDTFDNYNARIENKWPKVKKFVSCSPNSATLLEGATQTFTITVDGYENNNTVYYTIASVTGSVDVFDFSDSAISGSFTVNSSGVGSFSKTINRDATSETESFKIQIRDGSTSGQIIGESGTFTIANPSYTLTPSVSSFNEGSTVTFTLTGTNTASGTHYYDISGTSANTNDISTALTGSFFYNGSTGSFSITAANDFFTEGSETFTANARVNSEFGGIVASSTVTISDTSLTPTATVTPSVSSINEGSSVTFTVNTTNFASGTMSWNTLLSADMESSDISDTSGTVSISGSTGSISITATSDGYTETGQTESFQVRILNPGTGGGILTTSSSVTISDTSTGTTEPVSIVNNITGLAASMTNYMSEYKNPSFYSYSLDGDATYISDGGGDMYDGGNFTTPWLISGTNYTSNSGSIGGFPSRVSYANTTSTTVDTNFSYASLGYGTSPDKRPLTVIGTRSGTGNPVGWQKGGNSGADGGGIGTSGFVYNGVSVNGFTTYAFKRQTHSAGDPSHCDLYILLGHTNWDSTFGTINSFADPVSNGGNGGYLYTSGASVKNILAIVTLLSKNSGVEVTTAECQTVTDNITSRIKTYFGF